MHKPGDRVYVDFISASSVETDGTRIFGNGTIDQVDQDNNGFLMGRLDNGRPFGCPASDAQPERKHTVKVHNWGY